MGASSACFALAPCIYCARSTGKDAARVEIDVLMPFHSMTTTDSVEGISVGLAEAPSEVLNPPSPSPKAAGSRV